tara:strand:+ start:317 stop:706 length:390 start_codon:yes stop_codon:yes gene_type:complete
MDSKVLTTLAVLVGVLAVLYFVTDSKIVTDVKTETASVEETQDQQSSDEEVSEKVTEVVSEEITEMVSEEVMPMSGEEYSEINKMEGITEEKLSPREEVSPEITPQEELTFQKKDYNVAGYGGNDYSSF